MVKKKWGKFPHFFNKFEHVCELDKMKYKKCMEASVKLLYYTEDKRDVPTNYIDKVYTNFDELCRVIDNIIDNKK
jgi:hypothetical protein